MSDKEQILSLLNRYSHTVDGGDLEGFAALFKHAEWYVEGSTPNRGAKEVFENLLSNIILYDDGTPRTRHVNANIELDIDNENVTAKAQRYVTVLQQTDKLSLQPIFSGHYHDEFVKEDGEWRFARTVVHQPFVGDMSQHLKNSDFVEGK